MIILVGESASGKSTIEKILATSMDIKKLYHIQQDLLDRGK